MQYPFSDLVEIPNIQQILVTFQSSSGISTEIIDMDGQRIDKVLATVSEEIKEEAEAE